MVRDEVESPAEGGDETVAILEDAVSDVEALEERRHSALSSPPAGAFQIVLVELAVPPTAIRANVLVPEGQTLPDVLNDERRFVSLVDVGVQGSVETDGYLAVGKRQIVTVKALST